MNQSNNINPNHGNHPKTLRDIKRQTEEAWKAYNEAVRKKMTSKPLPEVYGKDFHM